VRGFEGSSFPFACPSDRSHLKPTVRKPSLALKCQNQDEAFLLEVDFSQAFCHSNEKRVNTMLDLHSIFT
jgi:hypothetical protein